MMNIFDRRCYIEAIIGSLDKNMSQMDFIYYENWVKYSGSLTTSKEVFCVQIPMKMSMNSRRKVFPCAIQPKQTHN